MGLLTNIIKAVAPLVPGRVTAWGAREYFNHRYNSLGTMTTLEIDSKNKKASLELELKGETQPLRVDIADYEVTTAEGKTFIEIREFTTSREWINVLAREFLKGKKFEVPEIVHAVL